VQRDAACRQITLTTYYKMSDKFLTNILL